MINRAILSIGKKGMRDGKVTNWLVGSGTRVNIWHLLMVLLGKFDLAAQMRDLQATRIHNLYRASRRLNLYRAAAQQCNLQATQISNLYHASRIPSLYHAAARLHSNPHSANHRPMRL